MRKLFYSFMALAIVTVLAVVRCFFLRSSDTGIQWTVMVRALELGTWFSGERQTRPISADKSRNVKSTALRTAAR